MKITNEIMKGLRKEVPYKWRVQSINEYNAQCVAYVDSRTCQDLLDEVVGPSSWQTNFFAVGENLFCSIGIRVTHDDGTTEWIWKQDTGEESNISKDKGLISDCFKRSCVHVGIGRFLYAMPLQKVKVKKHTNGKSYPCDDQGNILWDGDMLTDFINTRIKAGKSNTNPEKYEKPTEAPKYTTPGKPEWSKDVLERAGKIEKDGLKGSKALAKYLPDYNKTSTTNYTTIQELDTDEKLASLIDFVENLPPTGLI